MTTDAVVVERSGRVAILTMNRPNNRNANSSPDMVEGLCAAIGGINRDPDVHCAILTGAGDAFSSGGNADLMAKFATWNPIDVREYYIQHGVGRVARAMFDLQVPIIAAVNGPAYGTGCGLGLMCDIRIASTAARFAVNFAKLGLLAGDGGLYFLVRIIGPGKAAELMFAGDAIDADKAAACGLVSSVVEPDELMHDALAMAERIASNPGVALRLSKHLLRQAQQATFDHFLDLTISLQAMMHNTEQHRQALSGFMKKLNKPTH
jgi:enoyl-CoA hydratase/carnithine racemase